MSLEQLLMHVLICLSITSFVMWRLECRRNKPAHRASGEQATRVTRNQSSN